MKAPHIMRVGALWPDGGRVWLWPRPPKASDTFRVAVFSDRYHLPMNLRPGVLIRYIQSDLSWLGYFQEIVDDNHHRPEDEGVDPYQWESCWQWGTLFMRCPACLRNGPITVWDPSYDRIRECPYCGFRWPHQTYDTMEFMG